MVVAAGDDISMPKRTARLVELFEREEADFCWSAYRMLREGDEQVFNVDEDYHLESRIRNLRIQ